jgi:TRAP-type mannitol/chloroaromatic compound transport system permease large subunit
MLLALIKPALSLKTLHEVGIETMRISSMIYLILVGATIFSSVFRGFGGDGLIEELLSNLPGGVVAATFAVMILIFPSALCLTSSRSLLWWCR